MAMYMMLEAVLLCVAVVAFATVAGAEGGLSSRLLHPGRAADPSAAPALRILDPSGRVRWQIPVVFWRAPREELGGYPYPGALPLDHPFHIKAPLVFVGYGLTRDGWDDYQGRTVDGSIAVIFTGTPQLTLPINRSDPSDPDVWTAVMEEKIDNAKRHGAVAVLLERNPLTPFSSGVYGYDWLRSPGDLPAAVPSTWSPVVKQLALPTLTIGVRTLEVIVGLSSDLSESATVGDTPLQELVTDAEAQRRGLGPIPLHLFGEVEWAPGQLTKRSSRRCDLWYQPGTSAERDVIRLLSLCDSTLATLESLLSARLPDRATILLFGDWRSKMVSIGHLGWGTASGTRMAMIYEGREDDKETLAHELCHLVAGAVGHPPAAFDEGLARLVGDTLGDFQALKRGSLECDRITAANLRDGKVWTLRELLGLAEIGPPETHAPIAYPEAASFCAYLIRRLGFDSFRGLYSSLRAGDDKSNVRRIEVAVGEDLDCIEANWRASLLHASD